MTDKEASAELAKLLTNARASARYELLGLLESKLDRLTAENATREQIISTLKSWISVRQTVNEGVM
ncbi:hypothetical protein [Serratia fonticola]